MNICAICDVVSEPVSSTLRLWICPRYLDWSEFNERDEHALRSLFGLRSDGTLLSAEEVAAEFGMTIEHVRSIEYKALARLRQPTRPPDDVA